ncbi:MAG: GNAT family N-acetyltransferase [Caulobacteraceae bacterium]|nr:GNAT family N-acetyltransferase [Caulobacteraceae bacterium]
MTAPAEAVTLRPPALDILPSYAAALQSGWSPDNVRGQVAADEELARISEDAPAFVASMDDREPNGMTVVLPDGSEVPRLPGFRRWVWDGEFCGSIGFRWQPGTSALPSYVLGHIGYAIVPWKRGRGYATRALALLLPQAWSLGLPHVDITTDPDNLPSQKVVLNNGGRLVSRFSKADAYGGGESLLFRIEAPAEGR